MSRADEWDEILKPGEEVLWQGRPDSDFRWKNQILLPFKIGLFCLTAWLPLREFAPNWPDGTTPAALFFRDFALILISGNLGYLALKHLQARFVFRRTWYTLTNQRAFIARDHLLLGKRLSDYPITENTVLDISYTPHCSVWFAWRYPSSLDKPISEFDAYGQISIRQSSPHGVGFENIPDGEKVYQLMGLVQAGAMDKRENT
ncbi:hypothetical protein EBB79_01885 [Parasedimentitalea marina]|uniref:Uncharacterized protein n=1 Tax=Parasedimentitalea marina TaxID=2483033 RepID=A0A3T0MYB2_9RHOB|nr:hypothetical protein [Parasedimentitalea marina]AZV76766.1 hypothetical protein EBB79_01885 [Parasedimentitalea marina]